MKDRGWIALCAIGLVVLAVMNLPEAASLRVKGVIRDGVSPLQEGVRGGMRGVREVFRYIRGIGDLALENRALSEEIVYLRGEMRLARNLERENEQLREQLGFIQRPTGSHLIPCEVIGRDSTGWWNTARINKGRATGVAAGRAVLTADGLAGRTVSVSEHTADVLLLSDPACKVSVRMERTGVFGMVAGTGEMHGNKPLCKLSCLSLKADLRDGDEVVTAGMGSLFPKGLLVGVLRNIRTDESGLALEADIEPAARLELLEYVFVSATAEDLAEAQTTETSWPAAALPEVDTWTDATELDIDEAADAEAYFPAEEIP